MMLSVLQEYFPASHEKNRMWSEGDVVAARACYKKSPLRNLQFLLRKRLGWMNSYIPQDAQRVIEIGCGMGITKEFINSPALILTDYAEHPWVEMKVDAMAMPFENETVDILIANNVIHHIAYPLKLFREAARVLKPGGRFLIQDINGSVMMRLILRVMRHEGYSLRQNPFDESRPCNDPRDLWSANCALLNLLFDASQRFESEVPVLRIEMQKYSEFIIFPLSGGVIAKSPTVELPEPILKTIDRFDEMLVRVWPRFFALQRKIVLKKS